MENQRELCDGDGKDVDRNLSYWTHSQELSGLTESAFVDTLPGAQSRSWVSEYCRHHPLTDSQVQTLHQTSLFTDAFTSRPGA